jgi:hypothetical protein
VRPPYCIADDEAEAIIDAESLAIIGELDELVIVVGLLIMVAEWVIIGDEVLDVLDEAGVEEWQPARVRASTRPPPTGASRARERRESMGASFTIRGTGPPVEGLPRESRPPRLRIGADRCDSDHSRLH